MSIVTDRIYEDASTVAACASCPAAAAKSYLVEALGSTLDSIDVGVIIVNGEARILHANQAAKRMLDQRSPIVSLCGCLGALRADLTKELRTAIATAQIENARIGAVGIGVPLVDKEMTAATAHVLPLANARSHATHPEHMPTAAVFVARATASPLTDIRTVARVYSLTPAEARLVQQLIAGASLTEAATALGIAEATARTHRNHIFTKTGVSRRTDLLALITRLIPPVRRPH
jgi:DNA-binding CsgD family transcriptional regulator